MQLPRGVRNRLDDFAERQEELRLERLELDRRRDELSGLAEEYGKDLSGLILKIDSKERIPNLDSLLEALKGLKCGPRRSHVVKGFSDETLTVSFLSSIWRHNTSVRRALAETRERTFSQGCVGVYYPAQNNRIFLKSPEAPYETLEVVRRHDSSWAVVRESNWPQSGRALPGSTPPRP